MSATILLIEDDAAAGAALRRVLEADGYRVTMVLRGDQGLERARAEPFDLVITDFKLPGLNGLALVAALHQARPRLPVILMTAFGSTETVIEATKLGACEYLTKPFEADEVLHMVRSILHKTRQVSNAVEAASMDASALGMVGRSRVLQNLCKDIGRVAARPVTVLIRGATGTGKELVAHALHRHSDRAGGPFLTVNCAAIPPALLESDMFGHERGAFTGAYRQRIGRFEQATGGTVFLDEIGDMRPDLQVKLLRLLQEKSLQRLGGSEVITVDTRVLAATHRDLEAAIAEGEFREDLFYRLSAVTLHVPSLAERPEDIPDLVRHFLHRNAREFGSGAASIQPEAMALLERQPWPGNVRELENVVRQALLLSQPFAISADHVREALSRTARSPGLLAPALGAHVARLLDQAERGELNDVYWRMIEDFEPALFSLAIERAGGNQAKAARWLGITRLKMREKLAQFGLLPVPPAPPRPATTEPG